MTPFWASWVGLPWQWGADPRQGKAACCFRSTQAVREMLHLPWPGDRMADWYRIAGAGGWALLRQEWSQLTVETNKPQAGTLLRLDNEDMSFGVGALVRPDAALIVRHSGRLHVLPPKHWSSMKLYEVRQ